MGDLAPARLGGGRSLRLGWSCWSSRPKGGRASLAGPFRVALGWVAPGEDFKSLKPSPICLKLPSGVLTIGLSFSPFVACPELPDSSPPLSDILLGTLFGESPVTTRLSEPVALCSAVDCLPRTAFRPSLRSRLRLGTLPCPCGNAGIEIGRASCRERVF